MALATFDLLPPIKPHDTANFGCFHTLAVNNGTTWLFFAVFLFPELTSEAIIDAFPDALCFPFTEMVIDRRMIGEITGDHFPLAPRLMQIQQRIDDTARTDCSRRTNRG